MKLIPRVLDMSLRKLLISGGLLILVTSAAAAWFSWNALMAAEDRSKSMRHVAAIELGAELLAEQSTNYLRHAPRTYPDYDRDVLIFHDALTKQLTTLDRELTELSSRIPHDFPELRRADAAWQEWLEGYRAATGNNESEPRLEWAAEFIMAEAPQLRSLFQALGLAVEKEFDERFRIAVASQAISLIVLVATALIVMLWFSTVFKQKIHRLSTAMREAANGGSVEPVEPGRRNEELGNLTASFNHLAIRLANLFEILRVIHSHPAPAILLEQFLTLSQTEVPVSAIAVVHATGRNGVLEVSAVAGTPTEKLKEAGTAGLRLARSLADEPRTKPGAILVGERAVHAQNAVVFPVCGATHEASAIVVEIDDDKGIQRSHLDALSLFVPLVWDAIDYVYTTERSMLAVADGLVALAERRDTETGLHLVRMSRYAAEIAAVIATDNRPGYEINAQWITDIERFAPMHDIGKVGIPDSILLKKGKLDDKEWSVMRDHPVIGGAVLRRCMKILPADLKSRLHMAVEISEGHHEKYDGSGYPHGHQGNDIPLAARIVALADVFDALTTSRPYKQAWPLDQALAFIRAESGKHFDPVIVTAFFRALPKIREIMDRFSEEMNEVTIASEVQDPTESVRQQ